MKYIIRKFVDAETVQDAIRMDKKTPVHDCYLKEGEQPKEHNSITAFGFANPVDMDVPYEMRRKR